MCELPFNHIQSVMSNGELDKKLSDMTLPAIRSALGAIPLVGTFLSEFATEIVPNQRSDRLVSFAKNLEERLVNLENDVNDIETRMRDERYISVWTESIKQAADGTEHRVENLAAILANGFNAGETEINRTSMYLSLLSRLTDEEVIVLENYGRRVNGDYALERQFPEILYYPTEVDGLAAEQLCVQNRSEDIEKLDILRGRYMSRDRHLYSLCLIQYANSNIREELNLQPISPKSLRNIAFSITPLGRDFLKNMDLIP